MKSFSLNDAVRSTLNLNAEQVDASDELQTVSTYAIAIPGIENGKELIGLVDYRSRMVICEPRFTYVGNFVDGIAVCRINEKVGYVRTDASYFVEPTMQYIAARDLVDGICQIQLENGKWKLLSTISNDFICDGEFDEVISITKEETDVGMALFTVRSGNELALIRQDGIWLIGFNSGRTYRFIERNIVAVRKSDASQCFFNVATNQTLIEGMYDVEFFEGGYYTFYDNAHFRCTLIRINGGNVKKVLGNYSCYEWLSNTLVAGYKSERRVGGFDIHNIISNTCPAQRIDGYEQIGNGYWLFQKDDLEGIFDSYGEIVLDNIASTIEMLDYDMIKVEVNYWWGVYSLKLRKWIVLPHFLEVIPPDSYGNFRVKSTVAVEKGFRQKNVLVWSYINMDGRTLTREKFLEASSFRPGGVARVRTLSGERMELKLDGSFVD